MEIIMNCFEDVQNSLPLYARHSSLFVSWRDAHNKKYAIFELYMSTISRFHPKLFYTFAILRELCRFWVIVSKENEIHSASELYIRSHSRMKFRRILECKATNYVSWRSSSNAYFILEIPEKLIEVNERASRTCSY